MSLFVVKCNLSQVCLQTLLCGMSLFIVVVRVTRGMFLSCVLRGYVFHFLFWDGFLFCVRESWRLFVGIVLTCCVRMVLFAFLNSPGSERCLSYVKCRTAFCPLHNGLQVIRHAYPLFYMVGKAGWKGIDGCSVMRNGLYRSAERCVPVDGKGFFMVRKGLSHCLEEAFPDGRTGVKGRQENLYWCLILYNVLIYKDISVSSQYSRISPWRAVSLRRRVKMALKSVAWWHGWVSEL